MTHSTATLGCTAWVFSSVLVLMSLAPAIGCARSKTMVIEISPEANRGFAIGFDLVIARDSALAEELDKLSADEFLTSKSSLAARYGDDFEVHSCEWPPGAVVSPWKLPPKRGLKSRGKRRARRSKRYAAFIFAHYSSSGEHRRRIDGVLADNDTMTVLLAAQEPEVTRRASPAIGLPGFPCSLKADTP